MLNVFLQILLFPLCAIGFKNASRSILYPNLIEFRKNIIRPIFDKKSFASHYAAKDVLYCIKNRIIFTLVIACLLCCIISSI